MKLLFPIDGLCSLSYLERVAASAPSALPPDAPCRVAFVCSRVALLRVMVFLHLWVAVVPVIQKFLYNVPSDRELAVPGSHWNETEFKGLEYSGGVLPVFVGRAAWSAALPVPRFQGLATLILERRPCPLLSPRCLASPSSAEVAGQLFSVPVRRDAGCLACDAHWVRISGY